MYKSEVQNSFLTLETTVKKKSTHKVHLAVVLELSIITCSSSADFQLTWKIMQMYNRQPALQAGSHSLKNMDGYHVLRI